MKKARAKNTIPPLDQRLVELYEEYKKKNNLLNFATMLYMILSLIKDDVRKKAYYTFAVWKRKLHAHEHKSNRAKAHEFFDKMSPEEQIEFVNKPYEEIPDDIKEFLPNLVRYPEQCNFVRVYDLVDIKQRQKEIAAARLIKYMETHGFTYTDEKGKHLDYNRFADVCNEIAVHYDLPYTKTKKGQRIRIHPFNLRTYTQCRVTPKGDKMSILALATNLPLWYLCGYKSEKELYEEENFGPLAPFRKK